MKTIHKYPLEIVDAQEIETHYGYLPLFVGLQQGCLFLWAEVDTDKPKSKEWVYVVGTGNPMPEAYVSHIGTVFIGTVAWHVHVNNNFDRTELCAPSVDDSIIDDLYLNEVIKNQSEAVRLIAEKRLRQINVHGHTIKEDVEYNTQSQLATAARVLISGDSIPNKLDRIPSGWDDVIWAEYVNKSYADRLILAATFLAAEYDRINFDPKTQ